MLLGYNDCMNYKHEDRLHDFEPGLEQFAEDVLEGLSTTPKKLPCKYLYDERGSQLFERICEAEEYYIPNTEMAIMEANIEQIATVLGSEVAFIEYGSGNKIMAVYTTVNNQSGRHNNA